MSNRYRASGIERLVRSEGYYPAELERLQRALRLLHGAAYPGSSGDIVELGGRSGHETHAPADAPGGESYRADLDKFRKRIDRLAEEVMGALRGEPPRRERYSCPDCGREVTGPPCGRCDRTGTGNRRK